MSTGMGIFQWISQDSKFYDAGPYIGGLHSTPPHVGSSFGAL